MSFAVVVVAYGSPELLRLALAPLASLPVVVVDNSSDPAVAEVARAYGCRYDDPGSNLGFAAGVNRGCALLAPELDILVVNPDAVLSLAGAHLLHRQLRATDAVAVVSPLLVGPVGAPQRASWPFPTPARLWLEAVGLGRLNARHHDWVVGACLMLRRTALAQVGPFDESFFLYQEETDWQRRAVDRGWQVQLSSAVTARHVGGGTSSNALRRDQLFHAGAETYVRKWFGARGWLSYRAAAILAAALRSALPGGRGASARRRLVLYARGPRRQAGLPAYSRSNAAT